MIAFRNGEIVFVGKYVRESDFEYIATSEGFYILFLYKDEERRSQCEGYYYFTYVPKQKQHSYLVRNVSLHLEL